MTVNRNTGVNAVIVLIQDYRKKLTKGVHGCLIVYLEKSFDSELI